MGILYREVKLVFSAMAPPSKPVEKGDAKTGQVLATYPSGAAAANVVGCSPTNISAAIKSGTICQGFQWRFSTKRPAEKSAGPVAKKPAAMASSDEDGPSDTHVAVKKKPAAAEASDEDEDEEEEEEGEEEA